MPGLVPAPPAGGGSLFLAWDEVNQRHHWSSANNTDLFLAVDTWRPGTDGGVFLRADGWANMIFPPKLTATQRSSNIADYSIYDKFKIEGTFVDGSVLKVRSDVPGMTLDKISGTNVYRTYEAIGTTGYDIVLESGICTSEIYLYSTFSAGAYKVQYWVESTAGKSNVVTLAFDMIPRIYPSISGYEEVKTFSYSTTGSLSWSVNLTPGNTASNERFYVPYSVVDSSGTALFTVSGITGATGSQTSAWTYADATLPSSGYSLRGCYSLYTSEKKIAVTIKKVLNTAIRGTYNIPLVFGSTVKYITFRVT